VLLEHLVLHELRAYRDHAGIKGSLGYWRTPSGSEVDFVWWLGDRVVAIEAKHGRDYRSSFRKGIAALLAERRAESHIVYLGDRELLVEGTRVWPLDAFLRRLHAGEVLG
jgi:predicted AAA+ superfamily ATPase